MSDEFKCSNPFEIGKPVYVSTRKQLADWLNKLARSVGVAKSDKNPNGYEATEENIG